jgi:GTP-binding protein
MVDGVCLLVDANEGPMTQTKFVLTKALSFGLRPIVVLNKMDRPNARAEETETSLFDLFTSLNATDDQLSYPTLYASAKEGLSFFPFAPFSVLPLPFLLSIPFQFLSHVFSHILIRLGIEKYGR